jgi:ribonuclease HII
MLKSHFQEDLLEAGCDEAGRGCLAGPVFAASVILPPGFKHPLINDSKKLSETTRYKLRDEIIKMAVSYGVASVDNETIDEINILKASFLAMHRALKQLKPQPGFIIVDGNRFQPFNTIPHRCIVKGDGIYCSIAAASILAKTFRDDYMKKVHVEFPYYKWDQNKGYPTLFHREALNNYGITSYHRKTFIHLDKQMKLKFL